MWNQIGCKQKIEEEGIEMNKKAQGLNLSMQMILIAIIALILLVVIVSLLTGKLGTLDKEESCIKKDTNIRMSLFDAIEIAEQECGETKGNIFCNEDTGEWWIDITNQQGGCNPACVVNVETKESYINWRC